MARKFTAVVFSLGCLHASSIYALGLGELEMDSFLNEPLKASVDLNNTGSLHPDQVKIRLATREDFDRLGVDRAYFLTSIKFEVILDGKGSGSIVMTSEDPVLEPYLDFIVEARWPDGRLLREYTVLVDPPLFDTSSPVISASERVEEVEGIPAPDSAAKKSGDAAAASGTRVDVRKSDLAPGEMPQRDFNAEASGNPMAGGRYMIARDDTLWDIASQARPEGATVYQTMLDIQRLNPNAFIDGNINRIKAGFIIYLPQEGEISSQDLDAALEEVRKQNEAWEAGRASEPVSSGPSLRISAEPAVEAAALEGSGEGSAGGEDGSPGQEEGSSEEAADLARRVNSMEVEISSLERLVSVKDAEIARLQAALETAEEAAASAEAAAEAAEASAPQAAVPAAQPKPAADKPAPAPRPAPKPPAPEKSGGWLSYALYALGAAILAILAFLFVRRRQGGGEEQATAPAARPRARVEQAAAAAPAAKAPAPAAEAPPAADEPPEPVPSKGTGYGESKHEGYADEGESGDALAEADIYIAYGRYPQARELLRNALEGDPSNSAYRLKLMEAEINLGNRPAAREQLYELEGLGDTAAVARARELLGEGDTFSEPPAGLAEEVGNGMESDFADLEIESSEDSGLGGMDDDLDLSGDFDESPLGDDTDDEDLVIAADANGMSTKLDLARAYLDMGDDAGAKQILEEVMAEGSEENKAEAGALLERIG